YGLFAPDADFSGATIDSANFYGADVSGGRFGSVTMDGAKFFGADVSRASFASEQADSVNFIGADLRGATLKISGTRINFEGAHLGHTTFDGSKLPHARFLGVHAIEAILLTSEGSNSWQHVSCTNCNFYGAIVQYSDFSHSDFSGATFFGATMTI